jgi:hypothetical protein
VRIYVFRESDGMSRRRYNQEWSRQRGIPVIDHDQDDCPNLTFSDNQRSIADGKISLNVNRRVVNPACIAGVLTSVPNFNAL